MVWTEITHGKVRRGPSLWRVRNHSASALSTPLTRGVESQSGIEHGLHELSFSIESAVDDYGACYIVSTRIRHVAD